MLNINNVYVMPETAKKFVLLVKTKNNRYGTYTEGDKFSEVVARLLLDYSASERAIFLNKVNDKIKALEILKR